MICNFCHKNKKHLIKKDDVCICNECVQQFVNVFISNGVNIKLNIKDFKINNKTGELNDNCNKIR